MENTSVLNVRISEQLKQQLEELAKEKNETISDYVRELLETAVTQDSDYVSGIPQETILQIEAEAKRRGITT
ncbi:MAG: ribbon-helix-helix protein, CopG family, partial [Candidatus Poribacteria bacterium]